LALSYYAIKHEIEYDTKKSDPGRMIMYCSRNVKDKCKWKLYAHTMNDEVTMEVTFWVILCFICKLLRTTKL
jgi:hypothetical protein